MVPKKIRFNFGLILILTFLSSCSPVELPHETDQSGSSGKMEIPAGWVFLRVYPQVDVQAGWYSDLRIPLPPDHHSSSDPRGRWIQAGSERIKSGKLSLPFAVSTAKSYEMQTPDYNPKDCLLGFLGEVSGKNIVRTYFNPCYDGEIYELIIKDQRFFIEPGKGSTGEEHEAIVSALLNARIEGNP